MGRVGEPLKSSFAFTNILKYLPAFYSRHGVGGCHALVKAMLFITTFPAPSRPGSPNCVHAARPGEKSRWYFIAAPYSCLQSLPTTAMLTSVTLHRNEPK